MGGKRVLAALIGVALSASAAPAFDLTKIDRRVGKEPRYKAKPKYCLVVFGPKAEKRVWLVLDGDYLYADRNGNGDLTEPGERVERYKPPDPEPPGASECLQFGVKDLAGADGKAADLGVFCGGSRASLCWTPEGFPTVCGRDPQGLLRFADRPPDAPIVHFGGPLRLGFVEPPTFRRGQPGPGEPDRPFAVSIGTYGLGKGTFAYFLWAKGVPQDIRVTADIEFPSTVPGGLPVKTKRVLLRGG